jgi:sec-independent protein translocase protein TatB
MFDIGFWELSIIGVVALIVIGPERLPSVARTAGLWFGRMRRFVTTVKADIDKELKADELKNVLQQQADSTGIHEILEETKEAVEGIDKEAKKAVESAGNEVQAAADAATDALDEPPQDYLVKSDRYAPLDDEDYFDDEAEPEPVSNTETEHSESTQQEQENDSKA